MSKLTCLSTFESSPSNFKEPHIDYLPLSIGSIYRYRVLEKRIHISHKLVDWTHSYLKRNYIYDHLISSLLLNYSWNFILFVDIIMNYFIPHLCLPFLFSGHFLDFLILAILVCIVQYFRVLNCILLMNNKIDHFFLCLLAIWIFSFVKALSSPLNIFLVFPLLGLGYAHWI